MIARRPAPNRRVRSFVDRIGARPLEEEHPWLSTPPPCRWWSSDCSSCWRRSRTASRAGPSSAVPGAVRDTAIVGVLVALAGVPFALVATDEALAAADSPVLGWVVEHRTPGLTTAAEVVSLVGGTVGTGGLAVLSAVVLFGRGHRRTALIWVLGVVAGSADDPAGQARGRAPAPARVPPPRPGDDGVPAVGPRPDERPRAGAHGGRGDRPDRRDAARRPRARGGGRARGPRRAAGRRQPRLPRRPLDHRRDRRLAPRRGAGHDVRHPGPGPRRPGPPGRQPGPEPVAPGPRDGSPKD